MAIIERGLRLIVLFTVFVFLFSFNINASHVYEWNRTIGGAATEEGYGVATDSLGNVYVVGLTESFGQGESLWVIKYDLDGNQIWNKTAGGANTDRGYGINIDSSDNIYVTGFTYSFGSGNSDFWTIKYDPDGNHIWNRTLGGTSWDDGTDIAVDTSGDIYITGTTSSFSLDPGNEEDIWTIKYDSDGNQLWNRTFGGSNGDYGRAIATDVSGDLYVAGATESFGAVQRDFVVIKYDSDGNQIWNRTIGSADSDELSDIVTDSSGNVYFYGDVSTGSGHYIWTFRYNSDGNHVWNKTSAGYLEDAFGGMTIDSFDNIYTITSHIVPDENLSLLTIKYDPDGNVIWNKTFGQSASDFNYIDNRGTGITTDASDELYIVGSIATTSENTDLLTLKYSNALPNSTGFGSGSTDFDTVSDITSVSNMILMNANGRIHWNNPVNAAYQNYSDYVIIDTGFVSLDVDNLDASIDSEAEVNLSGVNCANFNLYYATGIHQSLEALVAAGSVVATQDNLGGDCTDSGICTSLECTGTNLVFTAQHFDGFGAEENGGEGGAAVPEFSTWAMIIGLLGAFMGLSFIRKQ